MSDLQKIVSTFSIDLQPVSSLQERDHSRLTDYLAQELGEDAAALLAEPVTNRDGSRTDWYARGNGRAQPLSALSQEEAADLRDRLAAIERQIEECAARLAASQSADDRYLGAALHNCLTVPGENYVYAVGGRPVLTAWGFTFARKPGYRGGLSKIAPMKEPVVEPSSVTSYAAVTDTQPNPAVVNAAAAPPDEQSERRLPVGCLPALLWLLFALLVAAILLVLLRACALGISLAWLGLGQCALPAADSRPIADLQRQLSELETRLLGRQDECAHNGLALVMPDSGQSSSAPGPDSAAIDQRLTERNGQEGSLQISLIWDGYADLDLSVRCSNGVLNYQSKTSCGGVLDVDSNDGRNSTLSPVENIFWGSEESIPPGELPIQVTLFGMRNDPRPGVPYKVRIQRKDGDRVISERIVDGVVQSGEVGRTMIIGDARQ